MHRIFHFQSKLEIKKKGNNFQNATFMKVELGGKEFLSGQAHTYFEVRVCGEKQLICSAQFY